MQAGIRLASGSAILQNPSAQILGEPLVDALQSHHMGGFERADEFLKLRLIG
jgi:hypothetical protein